VRLDLRAMVATDLAVVGGWLEHPHVARWWTADTTADAVLAVYRTRLEGIDTRTTMLMAEVDGSAIGWCQWYRWGDYPDEADALGATSREVGIDYAIGERERLGHGVGTALVAALVAEVRRHVPGCGVLVDPDAANPASRGVLERNGFSLVDVRSVATEPRAAPRAIYRLTCAADGAEDGLGEVR
jgi:aminoglycoside 6'-N-acetyltransferase